MFAAPLVTQCGRTGRGPRAGIGKLSRKRGGTEQALELARKDTNQDWRRARNGAQGDVCLVGALLSFRVLRIGSLAARTGRAQIFRGSGAQPTAALILEF